MNESISTGPTQTAEASGETQNSNVQSQRSRRSQNSRRRQNHIIATNSQSYQGECKDIGYILGLQSEKFDKKVQFQVFFEKLGIYIVLNLKDGGNIQPLYTTLLDPNGNFASKHKPIKPELDKRGKIDEVDQEIYCEEVKQFV